MQTVNSLVAANFISVTTAILTLSATYFKPTESNILPQECELLSNSGKNPVNDRTLDIVQTRYPSDRAGLVPYTPRHLITNLYIVSNNIIVFKM